MAIVPYSGARWMRGYGGTGGLFRSLFRMAMPFMKSVGKKALRHGVGLAQDALSGQNMKEAVKRRIGDTLREVTSAKRPRKTASVRRATPAKGRVKKKQYGKKRGKKPTDIFTS